MKKSEALNTLGLAQGASEEDIKKAHRKLIIENHPDKFGQDEQARAKAEEKTKLINEARDVLLNHSWDPEYSTSGTPYGAPFSYNPSAGRPQNAQGNPFEGWPFTESFVWTTWDENGNKTTYTSTGGNPFQGNPFGANPFSWTDPFDMGGAHAGDSGSNGAGGRSYQGNQWGGNPFANSSNPFKGTVFDFSSFFSNAPTAEELVQEAKADLRLLSRNLLFWRCRFC